MTVVPATYSTPAHSASTPASYSTPAPASYSAPASRASSAASGVPQTVREAAKRRAAAREAEARAAAQREQAIIDAETRRIDRRAAETRASAVEHAERNLDWREGLYGGNAYFIPFFDAHRSSDTWLRLLYFAPATAPNGNDITMAEAEFHFTIVSVQDMLGGDFSLGLDLKGLGFIKDADYPTLPYGFMDACIDFQYVWRFVNDLSLELGIRPGFYGDPENFGADLFGYPFRGCLYYSFTPDFAIRAGVEIRPGWDQVAMPMAGLGWSPSDYWLFELGVPQSLAMLRLGPLDFYGTIAWLNRTYAMENKDEKPKDLTIDEWRAGGGLNINISESFHIGAEAGYVFGREFKAEGSGGKGTIEIDDAPYFGVTLGSRF